MLLSTQPTQHRVCTKAPKLRGSGENNAILLKFYSCCLLLKTQPMQDRLWEATNSYNTSFKWLVAYRGGRRVTSKYRLTISSREDQIGECGSISFPGGHRGNINARVTPFRSHGVPLGSAFGQTMQFHCRFTTFFASQDAANAAPSPHQGP